MKDKLPTLRSILIYGLEILAAMVGAFAICVFIAYPQAWKLLIGFAACGLSALIDYRNDGWIKRENYKYYDYKKSND